MQALDTLLARHWPGYYRKNPILAGPAPAAGFFARRKNELTGGTLKDYQAAADRVGLPEAASLEFQVVAARTGFVAADLRGVADGPGRGGGRRGGPALCKTVHDFGFCALKPVGHFGLGRWRSRRLLDNELGGAESGNVGGVWFGQDGVDGGEGLGDLPFRFFADEDGFVVLGVAEGVAEDSRGSTPVETSVAMDACGCGGDDLLLNRSEAVRCRHVLVSHFPSLLISL